MSLGRRNGESQQELWIATSRIAEAPGHPFYRAFEDDPMLDEKSGIKELRIEYFIISIYMLLRHLRKHYVLENEQLEAFRHFMNGFHGRWQARHEDDRDALVFSDNRQQSKAQIATPHRIARQLFFEYCDENDVEMVAWRLGFAGGDAAPAAGDARARRSVANNTLPVLIVRPPPIRVCCPAPQPLGASIGGHPPGRRLGPAPGG